MPELPEVESARLVIALRALHLPISRVQAIDPYVCRPFAAEDFRRLLIGHRLDRVDRVGKLLLLSVGGRSLGLHLGMGGRVVVTDAAGHVDRESDSTHGLAGPHRPQWDRLVLQFTDGTALRLVDKRRLGRATIDPDTTHLGPDALQITRTQFDAALLTGHRPVKARLLDQASISGIGNLVADETLWRARVSPLHQTGALTRREVSALYRSMHAALNWALTHGGSHTGRLIPHRHQGGRCPRCDRQLSYARVGGRSSWWCPEEQR
ncbi:MAG: formamidopyrimidine-DNA glycosylase [Actinomycetota bacterium]|nr:formamidopyrimidine-DNA glycosylase [Actinomycetota bacterium]